MNKKFLLLLIYAYSIYGVCIIFDVDAETYHASLVSMSSTDILVGNSFVVTYKTKGYIKELDLDAIIRNNSQNFLVEDIRVYKKDKSMSDKQSDVPISDVPIQSLSDIEDDDTYIVLYMRAKKPGLLSIQDIRINQNGISINTESKGGNTITFPYITVQSILENYDNEFKTVQMYNPWKNIFLMLVVVAISILGIIVFIQFFVRFFHSTLLASRNFGAMINLVLCIKAIDRLTKRLTKVSGLGKRKFPITLECYEKLLAITQKSLQVFYSEEEINSLTAEELCTEIQCLVPNDIVMHTEIVEMFKVLVAVLYGNKKVSVSMRFNHSLLCRKIILQFFGMLSHHVEDMAGQKKQIRDNLSVRGTINNSSKYGLPGHAHSGGLSSEK